MPSRILIIEDEPANIAILAEVLRESGYLTSVATSGEQGLQLLQQFRPDLILLDIMMPGIDGIETCRRIKASVQWRDIPVIFLTARTTTTDIVHGFEAGAVDYVIKPFHPRELLVRVHTHLRWTICTAKTSASCSTCCRHPSPTSSRNKRALSRSASRTPPSCSPISSVSPPCPPGLPRPTC